jgi:hypothetical protein
MPIRSVPKYVLWTLLALLVGCGRQAPPTPEATGTVFLMGVDGLTWDRIETLATEGRLPHFQRLLDDGARAVAKAPYPLDHMTLWATIQTGRLPEHHQVMGQMTTLPSGTRSITPSSARSVKSIWQMLSDRQVLVASVGLPNTWPAEVVNGFVVSNAALHTRWTETKENTYEPQGLTSTTFPLGLMDELRPYVHEVDDLPRELAARFFHLRENEYAMLYDQPLGSVYQYENPLRDFGLTIQSDRSNMDMAFHLLDAYHPRVVGIYLELLSAIQPVYWPFLFPSAFQPPAEHQRRFKETVNEGYVFIDEQVGRVLDRMGDSDVLVVVSDHGFRTGSAQGPDDARPRPAPVNSDEAVLLLYGGTIRAGHDLGTVSLASVTPTILALVGEPVSADLDGDVLTGALREDFVARHPIGSIETYESAEWKPEDRYPTRDAFAPDETPSDTGVESLPLPHDG